MTVLPIVERELRVAARRKSTYWARAFAAFVSIVIAGWILLAASGSDTSASLGGFIFVVLSNFAFLYCLFIGAFITADCISSEKREGTLGLLFLTDLKGYDVAIGKIVATSMNSVYGVIAIFPVLAIPLLLGGTTLQQFETMVLALGNTLFLSLTTGLWISTLGRKELRTTLGTAAILLFLLFGMPLLGLLYSWLVENAPTPSAPTVFLLPCPWYPVYLNLNSKSATVLSDAFWWSSLSLHLLGWTFFLLTSVRLPRVWQDKSESVQVLRWRDRWKRWSLGETEDRKLFRERMLNHNPFFWLAARDRLKPALVWVFLALVGCCWFWGWVEQRREWIDIGISFITGFVLIVGLKYWLAIESSRRLSEDHQSGALELLLSTPLEVKDILHGQMLALQRQFLGPVLTVAAVIFMFLLADANNTEWVTLCLAGIVMLVADAYVLCWVGMWLSLKSRHSNRAAASTIARVLILPWVVFLGALTMLALVSVPFRYSLNGHMVTGLWLAIGLLNDLLLFSWSRNGLMNDFRNIAVQRFDPIHHSESARSSVSKNQTPPPLPAS